MQYIQRNDLEDYIDSYPNLAEYYEVDYQVLNDYNEDEDGTLLIHDDDNTFEEFLEAAMVLDEWYYEGDKPLVEYLENGCDLEYFEVAYCGEYNSEEDYAEEFIHDVYDIPDYLDSYIDYEKFAGDLFVDYTFLYGYVFRNI